jgi:hypothetical protein
MKKLLSKARDLARVLYARAGAALTVFLVAEPVRARALLTSAVILAGAVVPALAQENVANVIAGVGLTAIVALAGESARDKVTPVDSKNNNE